MSKIIWISIWCLLTITSKGLNAQVSFGTSEKLNDNWKFILQDVSNAQEIDYDDRKWQQIELPHDWSVKQPYSSTLASCTGYLPGGIGWYRKNLSISEAHKGQKVYLYFEGIYNRSSVYLNGHLLGERPNGYISMLYDATPFIKYGKENVISVRVDHSRYADSRWYTGSGIYRDAYLIYANPVHIAQWGVYAYPEVNKRDGILHVEVDIENEADSKAILSITNELIDSKRTIVARENQSIIIGAKQSKKNKVSLKVDEPEIWDLDNPNLYQLKTTISQNGTIIDSTTTITGFRSFTFDPEKGFALNEKWMKMKGVCLHHDAGVLGAAVPREVWERRLLTLKDIGVNAIRTTHNPHSTDLYELCDKLGLLVLNEMYDEWMFPKRKWIKGWNVGTPGFEGSYDIFQEWGEKDLADFVRRDRNHLSVFAWSIGNEVDYPNDPYSHPVLGGEKAGFTQASYGGFDPDAPDAMELGKIAKRLVAIVKEYDKSRPTTAGLAGVAMSNETEYPGSLDIAGYNYTEDLYASDHIKYPQRVIYGSENRHDMEAWKSVRDNEYIFGQFLWTGIDYLGESGRWPSRGLYVGLLDFAGLMKPKGYFRQSLWSDKPMAYIGTYPVREGDRYLSQDAWPIWNYSEGQLIRVVCYTNATKAKLFLNGNAIGQSKEYNDSTGIIYWDIPYQEGTLEAFVMNDKDEIIATYGLQSSKKPDALRLIYEDEVIDKNKGIAQIIVQVVDENGIPVMLSDNEVTCEVEGPIKILGIENGNNSDVSDYTDNRHRVFHGRMLVYLQATGTEGNAKVRFSSPWLKGIEKDIKVEFSSGKSVTEL